MGVGGNARKFGCRMLVSAAKPVTSVGCLRKVMMRQGEEGS
jgi:hypothetical protein